MLIVIPMWDEHNNGGVSPPSEPVFRIAYRCPIRQQGQLPSGASLDSLPHQDYEAANWRDDGGKVLPALLASMPEEGYPCHLVFKVPARPGSYPEPSGFVDLSSYIEKRSPAGPILFSGIPGIREFQIPIKFQVANPNVRQTRNIAIR